MAKSAPPPDGQLAGGDPAREPGPAEATHQHEPVARAGEGPAARHDGDGHAHEHGESGHEHGGPGHDHGEPGHGHTHGGLRGLVTSLLVPHSHDAADSLDDALSTSAEGIKTVKLSLVGLGLTALLQLVVVYFSSSAALLADTLHNFADASTAIPLWLAFSLGRRQANRRFTYGYGRAEDLAGAFVVLMIAASALLAGWESIQKLLQPQPIGHLGWVAAAGLVGALGNEAVAQYRLRTGQRIGSAALVADGYHARADGLTSLAVLLGVAGVWLGFPLADPLVGLGITAAILFILRDATVQIAHRLMDAADPELVERVETAARGVAGVEDVSALRMRWIGHRLHAELQIVADCDLRLGEAHAIAEQARHAMLHAEPKLSGVTVHVDPCGHDGQDPHADLAHHDRQAGPTERAGS